MAGGHGGSGGRALPHSDAGGCCGSSQNHEGHIPQCHSTSPAACANASLLLDRIFPISNLSLQPYIKVWVIAWGLVVKVHSWYLQHALGWIWIFWVPDLARAIYPKTVTFPLTFRWNPPLPLKSTPGKMHFYPKTNTLWLMHTYTSMHTYLCSLLPIPQTHPTTQTHYRKERDWHKHMLQFYLLHLRSINISGYLVYHLNSVISNEKIKKNFKKTSNEHS